MTKKRAMHGKGKIYSDFKPEKGSSLGELDALDSLGKLGSLGELGSLDALDGIDLGEDENDPYRKVEYDGTVEHDTKAELKTIHKALNPKPERVLTEQQKALTKQLKEAAKKVESTNDSDFWFCVCFETREQKEEFLQRTGFGQGDERYVSGIKAAKIMGLKMRSERLKFNERRVDLSWLSEVGDM